MILCVDAKVLKVDKNRVQKDVDIEDLLNNHTKYFNDAFEALKEDYLPIDFNVSIRSIYDNTVVVRLGNSNYTHRRTKNPIIDAGTAIEFIHKGYDLVMFMSSIGVMRCVDYRQGFDELMAKHSQFDCIGLYVLDGRAICPRIYSHIIMSDEGMKELEKYLKKDFQIVPITNANGGFKVFRDTLVIVKEKSNE